jgi:MFS superfamily sulfate permease-like transporter
MSTVNPLRIGLVLGAVIGLWHLSWSVLVAFGLAQPFIDFIFWMHFIKPVYVIQAFDPITAAILVVVTAVMGFVIGAIFGVLWNWLHRP